MDKDREERNMSKRHNTIGIKQAIRLEWMDQTLNLLLAGMDTHAIRNELHHYLSERKGDGSLGQRSKNTRTFAVNNLMHIWITPPKEILPLRDDAIALIRQDPTQNMAMHWAMISAVYPFWYQTALQVGRLLSLQDQITQKQILERLKEHYGDRQTIDRYAKYVVRSFVYWDILEETEEKGQYCAAPIKFIASDTAIALIFESMLLAKKEGKCTVPELLFSPALFAFNVPQIMASQIVPHDGRLHLNQFTIGEEYLLLANHR